MYVNMFERKSTCFKLSELIFHVELRDRLTGDECFQEFEPNYRKGGVIMEFIAICLSSLGSFALLFIVAKFIGHKQIAQFDFFDYITGITIGSIAAEMATELDETWKPLTAVIIYGAVTILLNIITSKAPRTRKFINGSPTIIMDNGKLYRENLKKAKLDLSEFLLMCRQQGFFDLTSIQTAVFEYNGQLTILPVSTKRPATPNDMSLAPEQELLFTELIMDGRILEDNLKRMGLNMTWLEKQLNRCGISSVKDVFLAVCDRNLKFVIYENTSNGKKADSA